MSNVLLIYDFMNTTTEVNLSGIETLFGDNKHAIRKKAAKTVTSDDLNWCDVCYANRPSSIYAVRISKALRKSGRIFMSLFDDDLLNLPKGNSVRKMRRYVFKCISESDIVITPNPLIISKYIKIAPKPKYVVVNTQVSEEEIKSSTIDDSKVRLVYAAGEDHTELFNEFIKPSLDSLAERYQSKLELTLIGVCPNLSDIRHNNWIRQISTMPYNDYRSFMLSHNYDIGLAPLYDTSFSNCKYFNKYIEYTKNGILGLYSNCPPYTLIVTNDQNGILVENTVDAWYKALCSAIDNIESIKKYVDVAQQQLKEEFSISAVRDVLHKEIDVYVNEHKKREVVEYVRAPFLECYYELFLRWNRFSSHIYRYGMIKTLKRILARHFIMHY